MKKIETLIAKCANIKLLDDRVLVAPLKLRTYETTDTTVDKGDPENKGKDPSKDIMKTTKKVYDVNYTYQKAIVVAKSDNIKDLNIGDTIIYRISNLIDFDLVKGVSLLKRYEIIGKFEDQTV